MIDFIHRIDFGILDFLQTLHNSVFDFIMQVFTCLGDNGYVWIGLCIVLLCIPKTRKIGIYLGITLALEFILNDLVLKSIVRRQRPFLQRTGIDTIIKQPSGYSFPSGHSASSFACATAIFMKNKRMGIFAYILAALIAFSRLYFYVHFPTDVLTGSVLGVLVGIAVNKLLVFIEKKLAEKNKSQ